MKRYRRNNLIIIIAIVITLCITLGYAYLSTNLSIDGISKINNATWNIHFENLVINEDSVDVDTSNGEKDATIDNATTVSYNVKLDKPGDFYEFTVDVKNDGSIDAMIETVVSKLNGSVITTLPAYLNYSVTYDDDIEIGANHLLSSGDSEKYKVRVEFKPDVNVSDLPNTDRVNNFSFQVKYSQRDENAVERPHVSMIGTTSSSDKNGFRSDTYREKIKTLTLSNSINPPADYIESWDISESGTGSVMAYLTVNSVDNTKYDLYIQGNGHLYANPDSSYLFYNLRGLDQINNLELLDTSKVTNMKGMFSNTGYNSSVFTLDLGNTFDTSKVTDMSYMFYQTGFSDSAFTLNLGSNFDTSNVVDMSDMFNRTGYNSSVFTLNLGSKFDTGKVTTMSHMFDSAGYNDSVFTLNLGNKFNTDSVQDMAYMFSNTGYVSNSFTLNLGDKFNTSQVNDMNHMFSNTCHDGLNFTLNLGNKFNTRQVQDMSYMFNKTGYGSQVFTLDLGDLFYTDDVTTMEYMFNEVGYSSPVFTLDLGDKYDTSAVTNMQYMFNNAGFCSTSFTLDLNGGDFDTANVTNMKNIFARAGYSNPNFHLDLGRFNTSSATNMDRAFYCTGYSNNTQEIDLGEISFSSLSSYNEIFYGWKTTQKIFVIDFDTYLWIINNSGNSNLTSDNVIYNGVH